MTLIDLSHEIRENLITYRGLPAPVICDFMSREESRSKYAHGTEFQIGKIEMVGNTGTYLDSPFHRFADGKDLSQLALESLVDLDCVLVDATTRTGRAVDRSRFSRLDVSGKAVLVRTGWDLHWDTDAYFEAHPYLTEDAAQWLVDNGAVLVGIDSLNIDCIDDGTRPVHTTLLGAEVLVVEHMCNLGQLPAAGFRFFAAPVKVVGFGTFPVRAFAIVP